MVFQFTSRPHGNGAKTCQLGIPAAAAALGQIGWNRGSRFHHRPDAAQRPNSKLEAAYHDADKAIEKVINILAAA
jgi:hypothetical protein